MPAGGCSGLSMKGRPTSTLPKKDSRPEITKVGYWLSARLLPENHPAKGMNSCMMSLPVLGKLNDTGIMTSM